MHAVLCVSAVLLAVAVVTAGERAPRRLSDTGLYGSGGGGVIAAGVRPFSPQYPLWSDGAAKSRWVYLPPGAAIDASNPNGWDIPAGTRFWKQFEFNGRKVETRMIWRASRANWVFATYHWNDEGTEATLAPEIGVPRVVLLTAQRAHDLPSVTDCLACHGTERPGPLGFNALQLSDDRDPNAIHAEPLAPNGITLSTLRAEGRLALPGIPPQATHAPRIQTNDPHTRAMLGYLLANCGSCHNGRGEIAAVGPTLKADELLRDGDAVARAMIGQPTKWQVPGLADGASVLIDPRAPEKSAMLVRMRSRSPSSQMPPLGTVVRDAVAIERIADWITRARGLTDSPSAAPRWHR
jgi:cytochrome c553